jgi:uncharacterized protein (TIGR00369 family)
MRPVLATEGRAQVELRVSESHLRSLSIVHGGVFAALLDASQGMSAASIAPSGYDVVTVQLNVNFLAPGLPGEALIATGEVIHAGRRTAVTRGEVRNGEGKLVASGTATLMFLATSVTASEGGMATEQAVPPSGTAGG